MPGRINGIGTTYLGKQNAKTERGTCEGCGRESQLESYETRLWFTFLFIPLVPLQRKQILNYCANCTRHQALPLGEWKRVEQEAVRRAVQQADESPESPEAAMELHGTLAAFGRRKEAADFAEIMARTFPDNADVQMHLGAWHEMEGHDTQADACFARALELAPESPAARRAVAIKHIQDGKPGEARKLLAFMEEPGGPSEPAALFMLAGAYRDQGDDAEALAVYELLLKNHPELAGDKELRKRVQAVEQSLGQTESMLPRRPRRFGRWVLGAAVAAAVVAAVFVWNSSLKQNQTLHVVNRLPGPVSVAIDGGEAVPVGAAGNRELTIAEGGHRAVIRWADGTEDVVEFTVRNGFFERFGGDTVFVLNPGGAATFSWEEILYSDRPDPRHENPFRIHFGEEFLVFRDIDYAFREPPAQLKTESKRLKKNVVKVVDFRPIDILMGLPKLASLEDALRYGEHHLKLSPEDETLLDTYVFLAGGQNRLDRVVSFLETGLRRRPVPVEWHRRYQELARRDGGDEEALVERYDGLLAEAPDDAVLIYLRGRLELKTDDAMDYYDRAVAADPNLPYPYMAKAYHLLSRGELEAARELAMKAQALAPENTAIAEHLFDIRSCLGEHRELEHEIRKGLAREPLDLTLHNRLMEVLVAQGRSSEAEAAQGAFASRARNENPQSAELGIPLGELLLAYLQGDMQEYLAVGERLEDPDMVRSARFVAHLERGDPKQAEEHFDPDFANSGRDALLLFLAWRRGGPAPEAEKWLAKAIEILESGRREERWAAGLLGRAADLEPGEVDEVALRRELKVVLLAALAAICPTHRADLLEKAQKLNAVLGFPHRFIRRVIEQ